MIHRKSRVSGVSCLGFLRAVSAQVIAAELPGPMRRSGTLKRMVDANYARMEYADSAASELKGLTINAAVQGRGQSREAILARWDLSSNAVAEPKLNASPR